MATKVSYDHNKLYNVVEKFFEEYGTDKPFHPDHVFNTPENMQSSEFIMMYDEYQNDLPTERAALVALLRRMVNNGSLEGGLKECGGYFLGDRPKSKPKSPAKKSDKNNSINRPPMKSNATTLKYKPTTQLVPIKTAGYSENITFDIPLAFEYIQKEMNKCDMKIAKYQRMKDNLNRILNTEKVEVVESQPEPESEIKSNPEPEMTEFDQEQTETE